MLTVFLRLCPTDLSFFLTLFIVPTSIVLAHLFYSRTWCRSIDEAKRMRRSTGELVDVPSSDGESHIFTSQTTSMHTAEETIQHEAPVLIRVSNEDLNTPHIVRRHRGERRPSGSNSSGADCDTYDLHGARERVTEVESCETMMVSSSVSTSSSSPQIIVNNVESRNYSSSRVEWEFVRPDAESGLSKAPLLASSRHDRNDDPDYSYEDFSPPPSPRGQPCSIDYDDSEFELVTFSPIGGADGDNLESYISPWKLFNNVLDDVTFTKSYYDRPSRRASRRAMKEAEENERAVAKARAIGVKIRDFGATSSPCPAIGDSEQESARRLAIFPARERALQFHYMRWLYNNNICDLPHSSLTADEVDRLLTVGFIDHRHLDFYPGRAMLAAGSYRRTMRRKGLPTFDNQLLPELCKWTMAADEKPPKFADVADYIINMEIERTEDQKGKLRSLYRLDVAERGIVDKNWFDERIKACGVWGLHKVGISDDEALSMINELDDSFEVPDSFTGKKQRRPKLQIEWEKWSLNREQITGLNSAPNAEANTGWHDETPTTLRPGHLSKSDFVMESGSSQSQDGSSKKRKLDSDSDPDSGLKRIRLGTDDNSAPQTEQAVSSLSIAPSLKHMSGETESEVVYGQAGPGPSTLSNTLRTGLGKKRMHEEDGELEDEFWGAKKIKAAGTDALRSCSMPPSFECEDNRTSAAPRETYDERGRLEHENADARPPNEVVKKPDPIMDFLSKRISIPTLRGTLASSST